MGQKCGVKSQIYPKLFARGFTLNHLPLKKKELDLLMDNYENIFEFIFDYLRSPVPSPKWEFLKDYFEFFWTSGSITSNPHPHQNETLRFRLCHTILFSLPAKIHQSHLFIRKSYWVQEWNIEVYLFADWLKRIDMIFLFRSWTTLILRRFCSTVSLVSRNRSTTLFSISSTRGS